MRINSECLDQNYLKKKLPNRIGVISRMNGWLTVDKNNMSRRNAYEN